jgi:hypothetical protein
MTGLVRKQTPVAAQTCRFLTCGDHANTAPIATIRPHPELYDDRRCYAQCCIVHAARRAAKSVSNVLARTAGAQVWILSLGLRDTKLLLEKPGHWREDCCITRSGLEHRRR